MKKRPFNFDDAMINGCNPVDVIPSEDEILDYIGKYPLYSYPANYITDNISLALWDINNHNILYAFDKIHWNEIFKSMIDMKIQGLLMYENKFITRYIDVMQHLCENHGTVLRFFAREKSNFKWVVEAAKHTDGIDIPIPRILSNLEMYDLATATTQELWYSPNLDGDVVYDMIVKGARDIGNIDDLPHELCERLLRHDASYIIDMSGDLQTFDLLKIALEADINNIRYSHVVLDDDMRNELIALHPEINL